jgi:hypothetical protein
VIVLVLGIVVMQVHEGALQSSCALA